MLISHFNPAYSASGFGVGLLVGVTGVGGGSLMTPLLVLLFGIHPATAVGTDLLYASITKTGGTAVHAFNKTIDWRITGLLAAGSVPATILTLLALHSFGAAAQGAGGLISTLLGIALLLTAATLIFRRHIVEYAGTRFGEPSPRLAARLTILMGATLGILVPLSSVGAGALGVTALICLYPRMPIAKIVGSDIAHAVPLTLVAGLGHWFIGTVDWPVLLALLVGSIPGILLGSAMAPHIPDRFLRPILAGTLVLVSGRLIF